MSEPPMVIDLVSSSDENEDELNVDARVSKKRERVAPDAEGLPSQHSTRKRPFVDTIATRDAIAITSSGKRSDGSSDTTPTNNSSGNRKGGENASSCKKSPCEGSESNEHFEMNVYRQDGDTCILSSGIRFPVPAPAPASQTLSKSSSEEVTTKNRRTSTHTHTRTRIDDNPNSTKRMASSAIFLAHIQQRDNWSCGFRNVQMMFYTLMQIMPLSHPFVERHSQSSLQSHSQSQSHTMTIPSILQLQQYMESSWNEGFDAMGKRHFNNGKIVKTRSRIGAMEVSSLCSFLHIDAVMVQFIVCSASRSLLGDFLWAYFCKEKEANGSGNANNQNDASTNRGSLELAQHLMQSIEHGDDDAEKATPNTNSNDGHENNDDHEVQILENRQGRTADTSVHNTLPVYLQWEGHSITIVGIERCDKGKRNTNNLKSAYPHAYNLLVLDPMKKWEHPPKMQEHQPQPRHQHSSQRPEQNLAMSISSKLSTKITARKDCQIVIFGENALTMMERNRRRDIEDINVVTAAKDEVQREALARSGYR